MKDEKAGLLALINELKFELKEKDKRIELLEKQLEASKYMGDAWIHVDEFKQAIEDARKAEKEYKDATRQVALIRAKYEAQINSLLAAF